ncbi:MAG TPA: 16S rRNA (guanine(966)-N(2))-methyltransferase RsmD [Acidimicrobiales bacterium]|nr:16S rRNA (guanine(966)-N(2))-methyltransferase RsmD [Acidimicrobiales bacterium]
MRVVGGEAGGRKIKAPPGDETRPTSDAVREAVFNAVASRMDLEDARVLDLFAGSGALGIEALSRGAREVTFVDRSRAAVTTIEGNLQMTGLSGGKVLATPVEGWIARLGPREQWDLVIADPPYAYDGWTGLLQGLSGHLEVDGIAVLESGSELELPKSWRSVRSKRYGTTVVTLVVPCNHPCAESPTKHPADAWKELH